MPHTNVNILTTPNYHRTWSSKEVQLHELECMYTARAHVTLYKIQDFQQIHATHIKY